MTVFDIIIPTRGRQAELRAALESVRGQTFENWRCWIAEDGETAETKSAVAPYLEDRRFVYEPGTAAGLPAAPRNRAAAKGTAPYIAFLDDDDLWVKEKLQRQYEFFEGHREAVLVASNAVRWPGVGDWRGCETVHPWSPTRLVSFGSLVQTNPIINSTAVIRRWAYEKAGGESEAREFRAFEDYHLWLRAAALGEVWIVEEALAVYRDNPQSSIRSLFEMEKLDETFAALYRSAGEDIERLGKAHGAADWEKLAGACRERSGQLADRGEAGNRKALAAAGDAGGKKGARDRLMTAKQWAMAKTLGAAMDHYMRKRGVEFTSRQQKTNLERPGRLFAAIQAARARHLQGGAAQGEHCAECIIFSMDRALQLDGLLRSMRMQATPSIPIHVLFFASTAEHKQAYAEVAGEVSQEPWIQFVEQKNAGSFRADLLEILDSIEAGRLFFLVDDIVFTEKTDLEDFCRYETDAYVPSLRMGLDIRRSYTMQRELFPPDLIETPEGEEDKIYWRWEHGGCDWGYPLSVDGHIFATWEMAAMAREIDFRAPNSFEENLQVFRPLFLSRTGVSCRKSRIVNIACNKVQRENENIFGDVHQDYLLEQWRAGFGMDYRGLAGVDHESPQAEIPFRLVPRSERQ